MSFVLRPNGDTDLSNAQIVSETALPQTVSGLTAGDWQVGRIAWAGSPVTVSATGIADPAVFLLVGQSNMIGRADHDGGSVFGAHVSQWDGSAIVSAAGEDNLAGGSVGDMSAMISFSEAFATAHPGRQLIFVQTAIGGTGFHEGDWGVGDTLYTNAVAQANAALAAAPAGTTLDGILWHQGERDAVLNMSQQDYETELVAMIAGLRGEIAAASGSTPFVAGGPGSFYTAGTHAGIKAALARIRLLAGHAAHVDLSDLTSYDNTHFDAASLRSMGTRYHAALAAAATLDAPVINGAPTLLGVEENGNALSATAAPLTSGSPSVTTWQWERSGTPIPGATAGTYTLAGADVGETLTAVQTATNAAGSDTAESAPTGTISDGVTLSAIEQAVSGSAGDAAYWATDDAAKMFEDEPGTVQITGTGPVWVLKPTYWKNTEMVFRASNTGARPHWDSARGLLESITDTSVSLYLSANEHAFGADAYIAAVLDPEANAGPFFFFAEDGGDYVGYGRTNGGTPVSSGFGGAATLRINGVPFSGDRLDFYTAVVAGGSGKKIVEAYGVDLSAHDAANLRYLVRTTGADNFRWGDMLIADNPGAGLRDGILAELAAKHGITLT